MDWLHATGLALIQGITEFLPISSSAHLILPSQLLSWPDQGLGFDVAVHVGSLLAVVLYLRSDVKRLFYGWLQSLSGQRSAESKLAWQLIVATLPAVAAGFLFHQWVEIYGRSILVIASTTLLFGVLLWWADIKSRGQRDLAAMSNSHAVVIGGFQALALIPGTSRSGSTMTAALLMGFDRLSAARFSFLLSIPTILGAGAYKGLELAQQSSAVDWSMISTGFVLSFISAWTCIHLFLKWIERIGMLPFVVYRLALALVLFGIYLAG